MPSQTLVIAFLLLAAGPSPPSPEPSSTGSELARGELIEGLACERDPSQTYTLYLPSSYSPDRRWPAMLILDPRGRSVLAAELFREAAETYGWVLLSSNDTRSDGPIEPNVKALAALWPEVHTRYATDPARIYAAGFSGGAMIGWDLGRQTGKLAGVIGAGGRFAPFEFSQRLDFPCHGTVGTTDFNYQEMRRIHAQLERWGTPQRLEVFPGPHSWMPPELARQGIEWMELQAMKAGSREVDRELVERLYERDLEGARELERPGSMLAALRRYAAVASTFEDLRPVDGARAKAAELGKSREVAKALADEERWEAFEGRQLEKMGRALGRLMASEAPVPPAKLVKELGIAELRRRAEKSANYSGVVAQRLLENLFSQTSFYLTRDLFAAGDYGRAVPVLSAAVEIRPENWVARYNLACALARTGRRDAAIEQLREAVAAGLPEPERMVEDEDLASLRDEPTFRELLVPPES